MYCSVILYSLEEILALKNDEDGEAIRDELISTRGCLENDTKTFEDLEFQYLEEETEWLAYREDMHSEQKTQTKRIEEKRQHIVSLEAQGIDNQKTACIDTKNIERDLWTRLNNLEVSREELKTIDTLLYELSGQKNSQSDTDDEMCGADGSDTSFKRQPVANDIMSQSLFSPQEMFGKITSKQNNIMSKSVNMSLFSNKIEDLPFNDHNNGDSGKSHSSTEKIENKRWSMELDTRDQSSDVSESLQRLKYNLSPPFDHKSLNEDSRATNLNLSIESDDFEVNPLDKRVPSQDDIDRICKVTTGAPISMQGASYKVIESIKEIERNRQLLLAQQGLSIHTISKAIPTNI